MILYLKWSEHPISCYFTNRRVSYIVIWHLSPHSILNFDILALWLIQEGLVEIREDYIENVSPEKVPQAGMCSFLYFFFYYSGTQNYLGREK